MIVQSVLIIVHRENVEVSNIDCFAVFFFCTVYRQEDCLAVCACVL